MNAIKLSAAELAPLLIDRIQQQPYCQRILHGRGKKYAGYEYVNIEWYPPFLFVQNFNDTLSDDLNHALKIVFEEVSSIDAVLIQSREWPDFVTQSLFSRKEVELPLIYKAPLSEDLHCEIKFGTNLNTGTFLDMRVG
ncbi:hypothetical protein A3715_28405 [Oleiphilus sp. HI0009]|nr:hypothetical protein A3715_08770 [Oleiphilus sp. HI0009]KZX85331.1 hypothetical protein A3715_28405 [Oleiphilus sp. HI0009]KZY64423.1 hypothetical protein A3738_10215 [Oleiphilus sp. HI0066]KZY67604.1 hypothetical protein A3739_21345 [Oleiphilus sp. HI0067]KZY69364.1 hypothetical protein A3739_08950 [Oleiphilus sp. HI0067]